MARITKPRTRKDQPEPEPQDFALNLAFASTKDLVDELKRRCDTMVVGYTLTDAMMESEPSEEDSEKSEGGRWSATCYTGNTAYCIGLLEAMKRDLLKLWSD